MKNRIVLLFLGLLATLTIVSRTPAKGRFSSTALLSPPPPLSGTNACSTAVALSGINCVTQLVNSPNELWFSFTASAATHEIRITQDSAFDAFIRYVEIDSSTCGSLVVLDSTTRAQDSAGIKRIVSGLTSGRTYYLKIIYYTNSVSTVDLKICLQAPQAACSTNGCEWINEQFTYSFTNWIQNNDPFWLGLISCWQTAANSPQISGTQAYMWSEYHVGGFGCGSLGWRQGEGIARQLPTMKATGIYVLDYSYRTVPGDTLSQMYVSLAPINGAPIPVVSSTLNAVPQYVIDMPTNITNGTMLRRRICYQTQNLATYMNCYLFFYPWSTDTCPRKHIFVDSVQVYYIDSALTATPVPCGTQIGPCTNLPAGLVSYAWTPTLGLSNPNIANPIANPSSATIYTLTMTINGVTANANTSCGPVTSTIAVNPVSSLTVAATATPNPLCSGNTATLTASGANSYTWNPGGMTGSTVTVSPGSNTTYTVTGAAPPCPTATAAVTLTVNTTPTITVTAASYSACNYAPPSSSTTVCAGAPVTFTATSGGAITSYTWTPGPLTGSVVTMTPTVSTVYTVSGSSSSNGCLGTKTVSVTVSTCSCSGTALPTLSVTTISGGTYVLNANATVSGNVTLTGTDIKMAAGVKITVPNGAYLRIVSSHLSACYNMWQGIVVDPGGRVDVTSNSLIEDAIVAIDNNPANTVQTGSPPIIQVNGAIFNCNRTAIRKAYYQNTSNSNYTTSQFSVNDAVITCRCGITFSTTTTSTLTVYSNTVTGTPSLSNPDLSDFYSATNWTSTDLRPPYAPGIAAYQGISLEDVGKHSSGSVPLDCWTQIGGSTLVLFDNLTYGINATNTTFRDTNSAFQNPRPISSGGKNPTFTGGYGINAVNSYVDWHNGIDVKTSRFIHLVRGIHATNYYDMDVTENVLFSRISVVPFGMVNSGVAAYGSYGVYMASPRFEEVNMRNNKLANLTNGIVYSISSNTASIGGNGQAVGPINITNNSFRDQFTGNSYTSKYIGTAIAVDNVITPVAGSTLTPTTGTATAISVTQNTVTGAYNGVYMANHQWQRPWTNENNITLQLYTTIISVPHQYGIQHSNCIFGSNYGDAIYKNTVTGYFASTYTFNSSNQSTFERKRGIWVRSSGNHYVTCNDVFHNGRGFEFEGTNSKIYWAKNTMNHNGEGHCLINNGSIGTQSTTPNNANDNQWLSTTNTFADTYVDANSFASNGILWVQTNTLSFGPVTNSGPGQFYAYGTWLIQPKNASTYTCSPPPTSRTSGEYSRTTGGDSLDVDLMEAIALDSVEYANYAAQNGYVDKNLIYRMIHRNQSLLSSTILNNFYNSSANSGWAIFSTVEDSLYTSNYSYATGLLNGYIPINGIEQNYKTFYQIYANAMQGIHSSSDSMNLMALASSCPMLNGTVVFQARALRNRLNNGFENYEDNCPLQSNIEKSVSSDEIKTGKALIVYPNPTNGKLYISGFTASDKSVSVEVSDITGKLIARYQIPITTGTLELNLSLNNGVYFVKCVSNGVSYDVQKVIISK
jgi:hypothetical protein